MAQSAVVRDDRTLEWANLCPADLRGESETLDPSRNPWLLRVEGEDDERIVTVTRADGSE